jgi:hypothetical protein
LSLNGIPYFALVPISATDFYFFGGHEVYFLTFSLRHDAVEQVAIVLREGKFKTMINLPLTELSSSCI